uniref:THAP domain-containing protein 1-like n=1 Tax=Crassostrea virginica TaxID=6565 RepID=A0A8B8BCG4_CRAVI|nr:THAP domain-containing protein 1-like [Crassostrea virginica]
MVKGCTVVGCTNRSNGSARERGVKFFKFPTSKHKRRSWIRALNRRNWVPTAKSFVCSEHFVSGWHGDDRDEADYAPSLFVYKQKHVDQVQAERVHRREVTKVRFVKKMPFCLKFNVYKKRICY